MRNMIKRGIARRLWHFLYRNYLFESDIMKITNIFDYNHVIRFRPDWDYNICAGNQNYGISYIYKKYSGYDKKIEAVIEHGPGLYLTDTSEVKDKSQNVMLVHSRQRSSFLRNKTKKVIFETGPFVHYSMSLYNDLQRNAIKKDLGRVLLVFPMHMIEDYGRVTGEDEFIDYVRKFSKQHKFDTVLVSLYFVDIERGMAIPFEREGWKIVTSGRRDNYDFLNCQKTIISLADHAIFQGISSGIASCVYMNVPVNYYYQKAEGIDKQGKIEANEWVNDELEKKFVGLFSEYNEKITKEQYELCEYLFGYDCIKTQDELKLIFEFCAECKKYKNNFEKIRKVLEKPQYRMIKGYAVFPKLD